MKRVIKVTSFILISLLCFFLCSNKKVLNSTINYIPKEAGNGYLFNSNVINFSKNGMAAKNVQDAVDEMYRSIMDGCMVGYTKGTSSTGTYTCNKKTVANNQTNVFPAVSVKYDNSTSGLEATNVADAIEELADMIPECQDGYHKENATSSSYDCMINKYTATFYYQSNTTSGSTTVSNTSVECNVGGNGTCSVTIPTAVKNSVGTYNNAYYGLSESTGNMTQAVNSSATTVTISGNKSYYALYSSEVTIYYPSSTSEASNKKVYRNQWLSSTTAMATTVLASSATGTSSNATAGTTPSGYSLLGFATSASTNTPSYATIDELKENTVTTVYQINKKEEAENATFYYSNSSEGAKTSTTSSGTKTTYLRPTSTSAAGTNVTHGSCIVPTTLSGEVAPYGTTSVGWSTAYNTMTVTESPTCTTGNSYYKVYSTSNVRIRHAHSTGGSGSSSYYRNAFYGSDTNYKVVLASSSTGTSNASNPSLATGYTFYGFATEASTNTKTYDSMADLAVSTILEAFAIGTKSVTPTFYYSNSTTGGKTSITGTSATQYLRIKNGTWGPELSNSDFTIPALTGEIAPEGTTSIGWAKSASSMSTATPNTSSDIWYKVYRNTVTVYKPSSTTACNSTSTVFYRNAFYGTETNYSKVLATTNTGTTENANYTSGVTNYDLKGFASGTSSSTIAYADIAALRNSSATTAYALLGQTVDVTFNHSNNSTGTKTSTNVEGTKNVWCKSTTAAEVHNNAITAPTGTAPYGTTLLGWSTSASTMTTATVDTSNTSYYAVYRGNVTNYYYNGSAYTSRTLYRNGVYGTDTSYSMYLSTSNTGLSNYSTETGPGSSAWIGLSTSADTTAEYSTVALAATSTSGTLYTVYQFNVTYSKGSNVSEIGATNGNCKISATGATTGGTSCTVTLPTITANTGYTSVGWSTTSGAATGTAAGQNYTINSNPITLYANAVSLSHTLNYNDNLFSATTQLSNGLTATYSEDGSYLTLNGTPTTTSFIDLWNLERRSFTADEQYSITINYISGSLTCADSTNCTGSNGRPYFVMDLTTNGNNFSDRTTSPNSFQLLTLPTSGSNTATYTIPSSRASANGLKYWLWQGTANNAIFSNYKVQILITKVHSKNVTYNTIYGTLDTPTKTGYTFNGWYTAPTGGTQVTSSSVYNTDGNQTLYAQYTSHKLNIQLNGNGSDVTWCGTGTIYSMDSNKYAIEQSNSNRAIHIVSYGQFVDYDYGLANYNNANSICFAKSGYSAKTDAQWILNGGTKTYSHADATLTSNGIASDAGCDLKTTATCTVQLNVNWVPNTYSVTLNNQSATTTGTTKVYYQYKTTKTINNVTCYYYTDSALTTCLSNGYTISLPAKTGYAFGGYYTSTGGSGTQYVNASGNFINNIYQKLPNEINSSYTTDITLYAKWTDNVNPTLSLSKMTYTTEDFSNWDLYNSTLSSGVVTLNTSGSMASPYFQLNNPTNWHIDFEFLTQTASTNSTYGAVMLSSSYYDSSMASVVSSNGYGGNGYAPGATAFNTWQSTSWNGWEAYSINYVGFTFSTSNSYSQPPVKLRNIKVYSDKMKNTFYDINITLSDNVGVVTKKYASGQQNASYFASNGTIVTGNSVRVTANGYYTVYVADAAGNSAVSQIQITDIASTMTCPAGYTSSGMGKCVVSALSFGNKTITKTFATSAQTETNGVNAATGGSGTYTYAITGGNSNNYFSLSGRNITIAANTPANTSGYAVTITATDSNTGATKSAIYTIVVNKASSTCPTMSDWTGTYDGNQHTISVSGGSGGSLQYKWNSTSDSWRDTIPTASVTGSYKVYVQVKGDSNHNNADCSYKTVTINQRTVTITAPTVNSSTLTYNTSAQTLFTSTGSCTTGGTMYWYSTPTTTSTAPSFNASTWTTTAPARTATNAGTYYYYYYCRVTDTTNNTGTGINTVKSVSKVINKVSACQMSVTNPTTKNPGNTYNLSGLVSGNKGTVTYALKSGGNNTTTASTLSGSTLTIGAMSSANDTDQSVDVVITDSGGTNYAQCVVNKSVPVAKYTRTLSWSSGTPAAGATLTYGTSYTATATASGSGGTVGSISYSSSNTSYATINSSSGAITVVDGNNRSVTITASLARTTTVKAASITRSFTTALIPLTGSVSIIQSDWIDERMMTAVVNCPAGTTLTYGWYDSDFKTTTGGTLITSNTRVTTATSTDIHQVITSQAWARAYNSYVYIEVTATKDGYAPATWSVVTPYTLNEMHQLICEAQGTC